MDFSDLSALYHLDPVAGEGLGEEDPVRGPAACLSSDLLVSADRDSVYEGFGRECVLEDSMADSACSYGSL